MDFDLIKIGSDSLTMLYRLTPVISLTSQNPDPAFYVIEFLDPIYHGRDFVHFQMREEN